MDSWQITNLIEMGIVAVSVILLAYSPLPRSLGKLLMHGRTPAPGGTPLPDPRLDDVMDENAMLRRQLEEVQERVEFTERMLAKVKGQGALPGPKDA